MEIRFQFGANDCTIQTEKGDTVGDVYDTLHESFGVPKDADPYINDKKVSLSAVLKDNDKLEFKKGTGRKG